MLTPHRTTIAFALALLAAPIGARHPAARSVPAAQVREVTVRFLANEGVMLSDGTRSVLVDALFLPYEDYPAPSSTMQAALEQARAPFHQVIAVLATHRHGDHFHPLPVTRHLAANAGATFLGAPQVIDSLAGRMASLQLPSTRARATMPQPGTWLRDSLAGVTVHALGWPHVHPMHREVQHVAWLVELGGRRILHAGDADLASPALEQLGLDTARIDLALLPSWTHATAEARERVQRLIRPGRVVLIHEATAVDAASGRPVTTMMLGGP